MRLVNSFESVNEYNIKNKFGSKFTRNRTRQASAEPPIKVGRELRCEGAAEASLRISRELATALGDTVTFKQQERTF